MEYADLQGNREGKGKCLHNREARCCGTCTDDSEVGYMPSVEMLTDKLTKPLSIQVQKEKLQRLGLTQ